MLARLTILFLIGFPVATLIWLVLDRGLGMTHNLVTIVNVCFITIIYAYLRLGHPSR